MNTDMRIPPDPVWQSVAQIDGGIVRLKSVRRVDGIEERLAMRLIPPQTPALLDGKMREISYFQISPRIAEEFWSGGIPASVVPMSLELTLFWADDGTKFESYVEPFDDEWTREVKELGE